MDLGGKPVVDRVIDRALRSELTDGIVVATTTDPRDDVLCAHLESVGTPVVRGSLDDVLSRYVLAAESAQADTVVRITCDCPLLDPEVVDETVKAFRQSPEIDYCCNTLVRTYPIGMDTEVFSRTALERAHKNAWQPHEREHVTPHIYQHPDLFRLQNVEAPDWACWPELRLTVDEPMDLKLIRTVMKELGADASLAEVIPFLRARPELVLANANVPHRHVEKPSDW
jgi:spore coat polysaccharide biosynthesis protein SpsF